MKQVLLRKGRAVTFDVPPPQVQPGMLLIDVQASCISPGTELMGLDASGQSLLRKALDQPARARQALDRMRRSGIVSVLRQARDKEETPRSTGYSAAGRVVEAGEGIDEYRAGDRVAAAGAVYAYHAGRIAVPRLLAARIPEGVTFEQASTVALGAIAMQGVRRAEAALGEFTVVMGCGALGLLTIQMLRAAGCRVLAVDLDPRRLGKAAAAGAEKTFHPAEEDVVRLVTHYCHGQGADRVIITAATSSNELLRQAFAMSRRHGRVVLVGVVGPEFDRSEMYARELDFVISTSYGRGRYDEEYERWGVDYPYGLVRWTEQRNMAAYLDLVARGAVTPEQWIEATRPVEEAEAAYAELKSEKRPLLTVLTYGEPEEPEKHAPPPVERPWVAPQGGLLRVALVGAGGFVRAMHLPNLAALPDRFCLSCICDRQGSAAQSLADRHAGAWAASDPEEVFAAEDLDLVIIGTRHDSHAELAMRGLRAGKAVFVEKPMCMTPGECDALRETVNATGAPFMVGYNRRFAPLVGVMRRQLEQRVNPMMIHYTMNAGYLPYDHWVHNEEGGGRILGEGCHIIDLFRSLTGSPVTSMSVDSLRGATGSVRASDNKVITLRYEDGSVASLLYCAVGNADYPKERMEILCDEKVLVLEDYCRLRGYGAKGLDRTLKAQAKGHREELIALHEAVRNGERFPIPWEELEETWIVSRQAQGEGKGEEWSGQ